MAGAVSSPFTFIIVKQKWIWEAIGAS